MKKKNHSVLNIASSALVAKANGIVLPKASATGKLIPDITGVVPAGSCVLVELITSQEMRGTTLFMPEEAKDKEECVQGYILSIGPKVPADYGFKVGDRVMLQGHQANPVPEFRPKGGNGRKLNLVEPHMIRAVLTEE